MTISIHLFILNQYETLTSLTWEELREENRRMFLLKHTHSSMDCFFGFFLEVKLDNFSQHTWHYLKVH